MGLPLFTNCAINGNLFIHFEIEFPKSLTVDQANEIEKVLIVQKPKPLKDLGIENTHVCVPFEKSHLNENTKERNEA